MRGIIFTELMELVEEKFGFAVADKILDPESLESGGIYAATGTYHHQEVFILVQRLSQQTGIAITDLLRVYGEHLFGRLINLHPQFIQQGQDLFSFLESVQHHIHVEVKKIHPHAELPHFETSRVGDQTLEMRYASQRELGELAFGLLKGAIAYFKSPASLDMKHTGKGEALFTITLP